MNDQVTRAGRKKKARMAGTRSDFLTRACSTEVDSDDDEDDEYEYTPVLSRTLPLPESPSSPDTDPACHSDSEMVKPSAEATAELCTLIQPQMMRSLAEPCRDNVF